MERFGAHRPPRQAGVGGRLRQEGEPATTTRAGCTRRRELTELPPDLVATTRVRARRPTRCEAPGAGPTTVDRRFDVGVEAARQDGFGNALDHLGGAPGLGRMGEAAYSVQVRGGRTFQDTGRQRLPDKGGALADWNGHPTARDETQETQARRRPHPSQAQKPRATCRSGPRFLWRLLAAGRSSRVEGSFHHG